MFRCGLNWHLFGERSSKYYFNLERRKYAQKSMYIVQKSSTGELTKDYKEILNEQYIFYKDLYTGNPNIKFYRTNVTQVKLAELRKQEFELFLSKDELLML